MNDDGQDEGFDGDSGVCPTCHGASEPGRLACPTCRGSGQYRPYVEEEDDE